MDNTHSELFPNFSIQEGRDDMGIYLHYGNCRVKAARTLDEFKELIAHMQAMASEMEENYFRAY